MPNLHVEQLATHELPAHSILSRMHDLAFSSSRDGKTLNFVNRRALDLFGWTHAEIEQFVPWWEPLFTSESSIKLQAIIESLDTHGEGIACVDLLARTVGGTVLPIQLHSVFVTDQELLFLADYSIDDNEAEEILRQTQARFRSIVDSLAINLVLKDCEGRRLYANQAYLQLRNFQLADIIGKTDEDLFPPDIAAQFRRDDLEVLSTGRILHKFEENIALDGTRTWTEVLKGPLRDADNRISGVQILFWDSTERKLVEQNFERERYLLHALLDNVPDSIYFKDADSRFVRISRGMARKFNLDDPSTAIGKTDADIFTTEHAAQARRDELAIMQTGVPIVALVERETWPDRPDSWCSSTKMPLRDASGKVVGTFGISRDITDLIKAEQELREARDAADQANRAKSEFLANMSHEIRTPMNGVIGMAELLRNTPLNDAQQSFLEMIDQSAHSLLRIINDILDFSKIEAGKLDLELIPIDLRRCVSHAAKSLAARAAQKGIELVLKLEPDVPDYVVGDAVRLRQVLVNLVGNAIKYTDDGEIVVRVSVADGPPVSERFTLHFAVADTGIGIPAEKHQAIFEAFAQADVSTTRQYGGTGLGLSISAQLVSLMDGRMWLESEVGVGSTFHFTACFPPASPADEEAHASAALSGSELLHGMPLMLVDDNTTSRETLAAALARRGLRVTAVATVEEALAAYDKTFESRHAGEGALVVDQTLGEVNGLELVEQLHMRRRTQPITILLATAATPVTQDVARLYNVDEVLQKPALQSEICAAIRRARNPTPPPAALRDRPPPTQSGLHFLLAEDGAVNQAVFTGLLATRGHQVTAVLDGNEAIEAWRNGKYDAIFMDVQMPNVDGLEATRMIRQQEHDHGSPPTPIIAITAGALDSDQEQCFAAGMDDYLTKPIDVEELDRVLAKLHSGSEHEVNAGNPSVQPGSSQQRSAPINLSAPLAKLKCSTEQHHQLVATFSKELRQRLNEISRALEMQEDKLLVRAAHSLRSAAALFEANWVVAVATEIEQHARAGDSHNAAAKFAELREATAEIITAIEQWLVERT
jgi:two-component system, sensor histidine kinase and response regulator